MDTTIIELCLNVLPWAEYRQLKGTIKLHYLYDHNGSLPAFMVMTDAKRHEVRVAANKEKLDFHLLPDSISRYATSRSPEMTALKLITEKSRNDYPKTLRLVWYTDPETGKAYQFLTNNMKLAVSTIAKIYKSRWEMETFFRWVKQHLKIKSFLGTSPNAVLTQIWVAMSYYLFVSYIKFQTKYR